MEKLAYEFLFVFGYVFWMAKESSKCEDCELLKDRIGILESELSELKSYTQKLVVALEESRRGGKRQAAPFRKGQKEKLMRKNRDARPVKIKKRRPCSSERS